MHALGSGKSLTGIASAEQTGLPYTAIVPASLRNNMQNEYKKFLDNDSLQKADVMSYTGLAQGKPVKNDRVLFFDEAHRLRNPGSLQTQRAMDLAARAKQVALLTGTPIVNDPSDLAVPMSMLTGKQVTPKDFTERYVGKQRVGPGFWGWLRGVPPANEPVIKRPEELKALLSGHVDYYAPEQATVPTTHEDVPVEMSTDQARLYRAMWGQLPYLLRWKLQHDYPLSNDDLRRATSFLVGPRQVGLSTYTFQGENRDANKAFQTSTKLQEAYKRLSEKLKDPRQKALIFSNFIDAGLTPYAAGLAANNVPHAMFHGGLSDRERKKLVEDYNTGKIRVALLGPSGSEGLSFKGTQLVQLLDPYWNSVRGRQSEGRALRYDSHWDLPEDLKNVTVQRYISKLPLGLMARAKERFGFDQEHNRRASDDYLENMANRKDKFNKQYIDLLKEVGSEKAAQSWLPPGYDLHVKRQGPHYHFTLIHGGKPVGGMKAVRGKDAHTIEHAFLDPAHRTPELGNALTSHIHDDHSGENVMLPDGGVIPIDVLMDAYRVGGFDALPPLPEKQAADEMEQQAKNWVKHVMETSFATYPPPGVFTRSPAEIADAGDQPGVAPKGLTSWQRMVLFHRNRGGRGLPDERRQALQDAVQMLSQRRTERRQQPELYDPETLLPIKQGVVDRDPEQEALRRHKARELLASAATMYHGSNVGGLEGLDPRAARVIHGEHGVFGTPDRALAVSNIARWRDDDFEQGRVNDEPWYMKEKYPGAVDKLLKGVSGSLYSTENKGFEWDPRLMRSEFVSRKPVRTVKEEHIPDVLAELENAGWSIQRAKEGTAHELPGGPGTTAGSRAQSVHPVHDPESVLHVADRPAVEGGTGTVRVAVQDAGVAKASSALNSAEREEAKGIPNRKIFGEPHLDLSPGKLVDYIVQRHEARRAGEHYDIRLGTPQTGLFSWASRKGVPQPGQKRLAVQQPLHSHGYGKFEGEIPSGYGAGKVYKHDAGQALVTKVGPDGSIHFTLAHTRFPERFMLLPPKVPGQKNWLMLNTTKTKPIPYQKARYATVPPEKAEEVLSKLSPGSSVQQKIDGAASLTQLFKDHVEVLSYRKRKDTGGPIVHTERVFQGRPEASIPRELVGTVLRGELYGVKGTGKAIEPQDVGGILNSGVARALRTQRDEGIRMRNALFDVDRLGPGRRSTEVRDLPYEQRLAKVREVMRHLPRQDVFHTPEEAKTPADAVKMWRRIALGKDPLTEEGIVIHPPVGKPAKVKLRGEHDVYVREFFPGMGKYKDNAVGGFRYSHEPEGPIVGEVGTGLTDALRRDMHQNPDLYTGRVARILSPRKLPSGALFAPALLALHEDYSANQPVPPPTPKLGGL
jgi:DNA ligase D-like protein (predicted 3'-phosphoesterase)